MPEAAEELEQAWQWYATRNPVAAERFADEVARALGVIGEAPGHWPCGIILPPPSPATERATPHPIARPSLV